MIFSRLLPAALALALALSPALAAPNPVASANLGESEALKCEEKIASVRRDVLGKYEDALGELQNTLQKAADLEGALTVRDERARLAQEHTLSERNFVGEPKRCARSRRSRWRSSRSSWGRSWRKRCRSSSS